MSDFLFGVLSGASFMLPGYALGYAAALKRGYQREDELRQLLDDRLDQTIRDARAAAWRPIGTRVTNEE